MPRPRATQASRLQHDAALGALGRTRVYCPARPSLASFASAAPERDQQVIFALYERPQGVTTGSPTDVVYDLEGDVASRGGQAVDRPALQWTFEGDGREAALSVVVELDTETEWLVRCDRVDFPPGGVAYRHVHPGPGIRRLLFGELTIEADDGTYTYGPGGAWYEGADYPVLAIASETEQSAFVRVLLLPAEWAGKRTIRYLDPADEDQPKLQRAAILLEEPLRL
jgi:quercetin dioxygenase-like cupin family protein